MREIITLQCGNCKNRNYTTSKNKKKHTERLETKKVAGTVANTREFLHDVRVEMKQVTWPSREDVVATTWVVIATVAFFGVFLAVVDKLVQLGVAYVFKRFGV